MRRTATIRSSLFLSLCLSLLTVALVAGACTQDGGDVAGGPTDADPTTTSAAWTAPECDVAEPEPVVAEPVDGVPSGIVVTSFDGTPIRAHWFPQPDATEDDPAPTVLMGPGWGLPGDTEVDSIGVLGGIDIGSLHEAGYNVLTWDPRGFGLSGGVATVNDPDNEGRDVQRLIDWVASSPVVELDAAGDPTMGMVGGSYGGGIQFVMAAMDCRVDAIVPIIAWHSLGTSLYKAETVKIGWAGVLADLPTAAVADPRVDSAYQDGLATGVLSDEDREWFLSRGPAELVEQVQVPTLIVQGTVDTLFTLDEALTNLEILESNDVPSAMLWYCGGHGMCLTDPGDPARVAEAAIDWLDRWVTRDTSVDTGPRVDLLDQNGDRHTAEAYPEPGSTIDATGSGTLELTAEGGSGPAAIPKDSAQILDSIAADVTPARAENSVDVSIPVERDAMVIGAPELTLTYAGTVPSGERPTRLFAQLVDDSTGLVLDNQITPISVELDGEQHTVTVQMEVVSFAAAVGDTLTLQLVATTVAYAQPRLGGRIELSDVSVRLPVVTGLTLAERSAD